MSDLIDREALLRQIDIDSEGEPGYYGDTWKFIDTIKRMPSALGTNLAEVGTNCSEFPNSSDTSSRQAAIDALDKRFDNIPMEQTTEILQLRRDLRQLPSAQPEIIRCRECKFASGDSRICMKFDHSPIGELDFCSFAERREVNNESD